MHSVKLMSILWILVDHRASQAVSLLDMMADGLLVMLFSLIASAS